MNRSLIILAFLFPILILLQVLIFNHIMLFNLAVPFVFIYFIVRFPLGVSGSWAITFAFLMGLIVDIFSDTLGVNALACTILAGVKPSVFYAYVPRDDKTKNIVPTITTIGWQNYSKYLITLSAIFCLLEFGIEYFSYAGIQEILLMAVASSIITFIVILGIDSLLPSDNQY
ncbi:MAG: rod shape-determining protein MreD [Muribaculaceae bacterium]|nr:rod shape-determining protein MreD [Muribaculaceae bacterium]MDE6558258.1 rod shape-determining protein MreD [Muribaculaceae bacterium]